MSWLILLLLPLAVVGGKTSFIETDHSISHTESKLVDVDAAARECRSSLKSYKPRIYHGEHGALRGIIELLTFGFIPVPLGRTIWTCELSTDAIGSEGTGLNPTNCGGAARIVQTNDAPPASIYCGHPPYQVKVHVSVANGDQTPTFDELRTTMRHLQSTTAVVGIRGRF